MIKKFLTFTVFSASIIFFSCSKKSSLKEPSEELSLLPSENLTSEITEPTQLFHLPNQCICVLFGYGYNNEEFVSETKQRLISKYGDYSEGGYIFPLVYPDDFKRGSKTYISYLYNYLEDKNVKGILLLGAPENTHTSLVRIQEQCDGYLNFPVFSFFSQDDILGMEDTCDFVLDKAQKSSVNGMETEIQQDFIKEAPHLIDNAVKYLLYCESTFEKNAKLYDFVKMVADTSKVERYCDPETNLISINHFTIN